MIIELDNLETNKNVFSFLNAYMANWNANVACYFALFFIMTDRDNFKN